MLIDCRSIADGSDFACDVCIVGAGPAGIAIADRLRHSGVAIILLESGGFDPDVSTQSLARGESDQKPYFQLDGCRPRMFGGSSDLWGGWCRPLEPIDFERRSWLPGSGWPISAEALEPYYADAAKLVELSDSRFDLHSWQAGLPSPFPLDGTDFQNVLFRYSPPTNFGQAYRAEFTRDRSLRVMLYANLTRMELDAGSNRVGVLRVGTLTGRAFTIRPKVVVLAAGAIENARLLLASRSDRTAGIGNEFDLVGRFFMEHLHVPAGHMIASTATKNRDFYREATYDSNKLRGTITPTAAAQERLQLLGASIAVERAVYSVTVPFNTWSRTITSAPSRLYRRLAGGPASDIVKPFRRNLERASTIPYRFRSWMLSRAALERGRAITNSRQIYSLYFRSEQAPNSLSRVLLSNQTDALGVPRIRLDWRLNGIDIGTITGWLDRFGRNVRSRGLGYIVPPAEGWQERLTGGPHHMGTTRMSSSPREGVVDAQCRVHSVDNLFVAGSSVFTTGGYTNPTFTLIALALRLADTLRDRLQTENFISGRGP